MKVLKALLSATIATSISLIVVDLILTIIKSPDLLILPRIPGFKLGSERSSEIESIDCLLKGQQLL